MVGLLLVAAPLAATPAQAISLPVAPGIQIVTPDEVLSSHTQKLEDGTLLFREAGGTNVRLITDIKDPEVTNKGDGTFHPASEAVVLEALSEIHREFLAPLDVTIYLLPYPRSGRLSSSADDRAIYLSPGVREYESWQIAFLVTHEIGHVVHRHFLPDSMATSWGEWATMRGASDASVYSAGAIHANRPHEIFAEDFRVLFGGAEARHDGQIENRDLLPPEAISGLESFYLSLAGVRAIATVAAVRLGPNPVRPGDRLTLTLPRVGATKSASLRAGIFDMNGRRVAELHFAVEGEQFVLGSWGGRDEQGRTLAAGAYWLRVEAGDGTSILPIRLIH